MNKLLLGAASATLACMSLSQLVLADEPQADVTVRASRQVHTSAGTSESGLPLTRVSLSYQVAYGDLNLASAAGAATLEKRVNDAAVAACREVGRQAPGSTPDDAACSRQAAERAMATVHQLIAAAKAAPAH